MKSYLHSTFPRIACTLAIGGAIAVPALHAQENASVPPAGQAVFVSGPAWRIEPDGTRTALRGGDAVRAGEQIETGRDAYVHLRMRDNAFMAVRPQSQLRISLYEYDPAQPATSRIKLDLIQGNTRAVSGKGGEAAKHNYRFNTPIAAIGLRGTDYTVLSSDDATRVSVARGAVAVTPLGDGCAASSLGPCATPGTRELSADLAHAYLEVNARQRTPNLVRPDQDPQGGTNQNAPGRPDEPRADGGSTKSGETRSVAASGSSSVKEAVNLVTADLLIDAGASIEPAPVVPPPVQPARAQELHWGRWAAFAQGAGSPSVVSLLGPDREVSVGNEVFGLVRPVSPVTLPEQGAFNFQLAGSEAYTLSAGILQAASVTSGSLNIDFSQRSFGTSLAVTHGQGAEQLQASGKVQFQGYLVADPAKSNMNMSGILGNGGHEAAYVFDKSLAAGGNLLGAVRWVR
jgi:hypothetical protein